ncbi:MAG TPA: adenylate/guanylate cyclase domain-containing protein [Candidatus Angelobacter sp.]
MAALTIAVLVGVWISARREVRNDVRGELLVARGAFVINEGEHLHEHAVEAAAIAEDDDLPPLLSSRDTKGVCAWLSRVLAGKSTPVNPEDAFDIVAILLPNGDAFGVVLRGAPACEARELKWRLPVLSNKDLNPEITNWEADNRQLFELIEAPIHDTQDRRIGAFVLGFNVSDALARHIKEHTGQDNLVWHQEGNKSHLLGASDPSLRYLLAPAVKNWRTGFEVVSGGYAILDGSVEDHADLVYNPEGLHVALVQSVDGKLEPFRRLEYLLAFMALLTLVLGWLLGALLAGPIATPLVNLARAAENVARDQLEIADHLLQSHPKRLMHAKDEIGVLGRSFRDMLQGLRERLAMFPFISEATLTDIRRNTKGGSANVRTSLAILFADVRQFSKFSETRDPEEVIGLLNEVLAIEAEIIKKHQGDIDKFVGDAVIAWFHGEDRCLRAVRAADEMLSTLGARFAGQPGTTIGIGIHVGEVVVGSIGSKTRKDYTAIGSVVNMAARFCSNAAVGQILVSQAVRIELDTQVTIKPLRPIFLKGFFDPVEVFEVSLAKGAGA